MRRAYWTADFAEAHVVEAMLRAHGVNAHVFDAQMVRQDWFKTLALGGYRVMVADADTTRAADLVGQYRSGTLAFADEAVERPACPQCTMPGHDDPAPRRIVFALLSAAEAVFTLWFLSLARGSDAILALVLYGSAIVIPMVALVSTRYLRGCYVCSQCATHWRTRPTAFETMAHEVDTAADTDDTAKGGAIP